MSARKRADLAATSMSNQTYEEIVDRRLMHRQILSLMLADHQREMRALCRLFDGDHLRRRGSLTILQDIDDELGKQIAIVEGLKAQIKLMGAGE